MSGIDEQFEYPVCIRCETSPLYWTLGYHNYRIWFYSRKYSLNKAGLKRGKVICRFDDYSYIGKFDLNVKIHLPDYIWCSECSQKITKYDVDSQVFIDRVVGTMQTFYKRGSYLEWDR